MSVSLILVPTVLGIAAVVGGSGIAGVVSQSIGERTADPGSGPVPVQVQTRMKDQTLLRAALSDLGASDIRTNADRISGELSGILLEMIRGTDGVWTAHLSSNDGADVGVDEAQALIARLDTAYARRVQQAVAERIRRRAGDAGFELVSETRDTDDAVTMVLNVREQVS